MSPFGPLYLVTGDRGLCRIDFKRPGAIKASRRATYRAAVRFLKAYFQGRIVRARVPLDTSGLGRFDRRVLAAVRKIPYGQTASYAQIARRAGYPGASRAVGQAVGRNRWPIIIPCHRVIRSDGSLGGFGGGLTWKKRLLSLEKNSI